MNRPLEISEPLIDATLIEAPQGIVVPMANYSGRSLAEVTVKIRNVGEFKSVESVRRGILAFEKSGRDLKVKLPIDWADMLVIRR